MARDRKQISGVLQAKDNDLVEDKSASSQVDRLILMPYNPRSKVGNRLWTEGKRLNANTEDSRQTKNYCEECLNILVKQKKIKNLVVDTEYEQNTIKVSASYVDLISGEQKTTVISWGR